MKKNTTKEYIHDLALTAMFLALGLVLPFLTGQIPQIGNMLLPMHLPVFLCGLICGWQYGGIVGFILPLLRYTLFSMPPMPNGLAMSFSLPDLSPIFNRDHYICSRMQYNPTVFLVVSSTQVYNKRQTLSSAWRLFFGGVLRQPLTEV